jgi:hypothetical protein
LVPPQRARNHWSAHWLERAARCTFGAVTTSLATFSGVAHPASNAARKAQHCFAILLLCSRCIDSEYYRNRFDLAMMESLCTPLT